MALFTSLSFRKQRKEKMSNYASINEFSQGWNFFTKNIDGDWGKFPCSEFACSGCDDWLDADNQNRNVYEL